MQETTTVNGFLHVLGEDGDRVPLGFGAGMRKARLATGLRQNRTVSQGLMADMVTAELKRMGYADRTVSQSVWSQYESEGSEPGLVVIRATSRVSGIPEAEIISPPEPPPPDPAAELRYINPDEDARAAKKVAESKSKGQQRAKGARKPRA